MTPHLEKRLENDLNEIRSRIADQGRLAEEAVTKAVNALQTGNRQLAYDTVMNDHPINRNMRYIDRLCHKFLAVHLPTAGHLRFVSSILKLNAELESVTDALLLAMHDLRSVLVRKKADRVLNDD